MMDSRVLGYLWGGVARKRVPLMGSDAAAYSPLRGLERSVRN